MTGSPNKRRAGSLRKSAGVVTSVTALLLMALSAFAGAASAHEGEFARFDFCPTETPEAEHCLYSLTTGGIFVLGNKKAPIVNPVTVQGAYTEPDETTGMSRFFGATNGETLSKTPEPVPGGLAGLVPPESLPEALKIIYKAVLENGFTGVNATLELAGPASQIEISNLHLLEEQGVSLKLPVKVHLENPFLGSACYVGSETTPIVLELTTGTTSPNPPNKPISGTSGEIIVTEGGRIAELKENKLVENNWAAPGATGCGPLPLSELVVDPIVDLSSGLPSTAGHNTAELISNVFTATTTAVRNH